MSMCTCACITFRERKGSEKEMEGGSEAIIIIIHNIIKHSFDLMVHVQPNPRKKNPQENTDNGGYRYSTCTMFICLKLILCSL